MAKVMPAIPVMVLPWASTALPEKLTSRGTVADGPDRDACCAFIREQQRNEDTANHASRCFLQLMTLLHFSQNYSVPPGANLRAEIVVKFVLFRTRFLERDRSYLACQSNVLKLAIKFSQSFSRPLYVSPEQSLVRV